MVTVPVFFSPRVVLPAHHPITNLHVLMDSPEHETVTCLSLMERLEPAVASDALLWPHSWTLAARLISLSQCFWPTEPDKASVSPAVAAAGSETREEAAAPTRMSSVSSSVWSPRGYGGRTGGGG